MEGRFVDFLRQNTGLLGLALVFLLVLNHYSPKAASWVMALILVGLLVTNWSKLAYLFER